MDGRRPRPLLVVGSMRSGTTLLNRLLAAHPAIAMLYHPTRFFESKAALRDLGPAGYVAKLTEEYGYFADMGEAVQARVQAALSALPEGAAAGEVYGTLMLALAGRPGAEVIGEKYAGRGREMQPFRQGVPDGRIIMVVRDPRDVLLSNRKRVEQEVDVETFWRGAHLMALDDWAQLAVLHRAFDQAQGGVYMHILYEDLVRAPEAGVRRLCQFLDVPFVASMLDEGALRHEDGREWSANTSHGEPYRAVSAGSVARYRDGLSAGEMLLVEALLADHLRFFGYALDSVVPDTDALVEACDLYLALGRALREHAVPNPQLYAPTRSEDDNLLWFVDKVVAVSGLDRAEFVKGFLAGRRVTAREVGHRSDRAAEAIVAEIVALRRSLEWMPPEIVRLADRMSEGGHSLQALVSLPGTVEALTRELRNVRSAVDRFPTALNVVKRAIRKPPE